MQMMNLMNLNSTMNLTMNNMKTFSEKKKLFFRETKLVSMTDLKPLPSPDLPIVGHTRLEGPLMKLGTARTRLRYFVQMSDDRLYYYRRQGGVRARGFIDLRSATCIRPLGSGEIFCKKNHDNSNNNDDNDENDLNLSVGAERTFLISTPNRRWFLMAGSARAMHAWCDGLSAVVERRLSHRILSDDAQDGDERQQQTWTRQDRRTALRAIDIEFRGARRRHDGVGAVSLAMARSESAPHAALLERMATPPPFPAPDPPVAGKERSVSNVDGAASSSAAAVAASSTTLNVAARLSVAVRRSLATTSTDDFHINMVAGKAAARRRKVGAALDLGFFSDDDAELVVAAAPLDGGGDNDDGDASASAARLSRTSSDAIASMAAAIAMPARSKCGSRDDNDVDAHDGDVGGDKALLGSPFVAPKLLPGEEVVWRCSYVALLYTDSSKTTLHKAARGALRRGFGVARQQDDEGGGKRSDRIRSIALSKSGLISMTAASSADDLSTTSRKRSKKKRKKHEQAYQYELDGLLVLTNHKLQFLPARSAGMEPVDVPYFALRKADKGNKRASAVVSTFDGRLLVFSFAAHSADQRRTFFAKLASLRASSIDRRLVFAFAYAQRMRSLTPSMARWTFDIESDFARQGLPDRRWRLVDNRDFSICETYPPLLVVPASIDDETVRASASYRTKHRLPVVTWRHANGATLSRSSQPGAGLLGAVNRCDEALLDAMARSGGGKLELLDARPQVNAEANRLKGAGYESVANKSTMSISFLNIDNIHVMRESLSALHDLCQPQNESNDRWLSALEATQWLAHLKRILRGAARIVELIDSGAASVLAHCSDGWDRTPQLCALAQLLLEPFYRTVHGFATLVEKEWCAFGHKFADRCGHFTGKSSESSPVFVQFLDCVYQLTLQFPAEFEFNEYLLRFVGQASQDHVFGTFLGNSMAERVAERVPADTISVWAHVYANIDTFQSATYDSASSVAVLYPSANIQSFQLWQQYYFRWSHTTKNKSTLSALDLLTEENRLLRQALRQQERQLAQQRTQQRRSKQKNFAPRSSIQINVQV
jgi:myotubularin-related protein 1/2